MSPGVPSTFQSHFAITEHVVRCLATSTQFAQIRRGLLPSFEVSSSGECVNAGIEEEFECALLQVVHEAFPDQILPFCRCKGKIMSLHRETFHVFLPLLPSFHIQCSFHRICDVLREFVLQLASLSSGEVGHLAKGGVGFKRNLVYSFCLNTCALLMCVLRFALYCCIYGTRALVALGGSPAQLLIALSVRVSRDFS